MEESSIMEAPKPSPFETIWENTTWTVDLTERVLRTAQFALMGAIVLGKGNGTPLRKWMNGASTIRYTIYATGTLRDVVGAFADELEDNDYYDDDPAYAYDGIRDSSWFVCNAGCLLLFLDDFTSFNLGENRVWVDGMFNASWLIGAGACALHQVEQVQNDGDKSLLTDGELHQATIDLVYTVAMILATEGKFQAIAGAAAGVVGAARMIWPENEEDGNVVEIDLE